MSFWRRLIDRIKLPTAGLVFQLFAIILLPLTLLLVAITFGSISIHNQAMRSLVGERDQRAALIAAGALNAQIENRQQELDSFSQVLRANQAQSLANTISNQSSLVSDFDAGVAVFDLQGNLRAAKGDEQFWTTWMNDKTDWQNVYASLAANNNQLMVYSNPTNTKQFGLISAKGPNQDMVVGAFAFTPFIEKTVSNLILPGGQLSILLVGSSDQVLYAQGNLSDQTSSHPGVAQALQGQSGITYVKAGADEHVTAYSPVSGAGWALITEESWEAVVTPTLRSSQIAPLVLVPAVVIMVLALYLGASQVVRPLRRLESKAGTLANGDFNTIHEPVGGIAEIQHLQSELIHMASKVREAQRSLHGYIGAITTAQEDERRRLARELHDDTLQALIALKQRVQLAQLELQPASRPASQQSAELDEIAGLTEQTIDNLRRLTRALRPVYLEDLGLVPALEMLARDTGQASGFTIEFHRLGTEKRLDPVMELALYRIAQEALTNIAHHAHARQVSIQISYSREIVSLQVEDDGVGFNLPTSLAGYAASGHYGLLGLHERAELIGATLDIHTSPGRGTRLVVTLPA